MFGLESATKNHEALHPTLVERFKLNHNLPLEDYDAECVRVASAARDFVVGNYALNGKKNDTQLLAFIDFCNAIVRTGHLSNPSVWDDAVEELENYLS